MKSFQPVGAIAVATFHQMRRDRSVIVFLLLLPIGLMVLMGNIYAAEDDDVPVLAVRVTEGDVVGALVVDTIARSGAATIEPVASVEAVDDLVRRRQVDAGLTAAGGVVTLVGAPDVQLPSGVRFVVQGAVSRVDRAVAMTPDALRADRAAIDRSLASLPPAPRLDPPDVDASRRQAAIGVLVLVTFMNLFSYASLVPSHRSLGVFGRLRATPSTRAAITGAYAATFGLVAIVQLAVSLTAGRLLVGIEWGPTLPVVAIALALAVAAAGVAATVATLLPTPESGSSIGGPVGFALGMLGGCLWPLQFVGGPLATIGRFVPHQWAVAALNDVAGGVPWTTALVGPVVALLAVGIAGSCLGAVRLAASWR